MSDTLYTNPALRHDFLLLFDVTDGNPNGDPDAGNMPRIDPETGQGLVTDVCLKRKIRNYVALRKTNEPGYGIFIQERGILNQQIENAYRELNINLQGDPDSKADGAKRNKTGVAQGGEIGRGRKQLCDTKYDIRLFGGVLMTGPNAGQVRGPVQLTFGRSVDPIASMEVAITRMAVATEKEAEAQGGDNRTMGRKAVLPYGLYIAKGFITPAFAQQTGVTADDLALLWEALQGMFDIDHSAARGQMSCRGLYVFTHTDERGLGNAPAHRLFDPVMESIRKKSGVESPRRFSDYVVPRPAVPDAYVGKVELTTLVDG
jgi:CRISPR-associated protein Csd2